MYLQVQIRQQVCPGSTDAMCVCGVGIREYSIALVLNHCADASEVLKAFNCKGCITLQENQYTVIPVSIYSYLFKIIILKPKRTAWFLSYQILS